MPIVSLQSFVHVCGLYKQRHGTVVEPRYFSSRLVDLVEKVVMDEASQVSAQVLCEREGFMQHFFCVVVILSK